MLWAACAAAVAAWLGFLTHVVRRHARAQRVLQERVALLNRAVLRQKQRRAADSQRTVRMTEAEPEAAKSQGRRSKPPTA